MKRHAWVALVGIVVAAHEVPAAQDGRPAHPKSLGFWSHHDPDPRLARPGYESWTPSDVAGFLALYPDAYVDLSWGDGKPPGQTTSARYASLANEVQAIAAARGVNVDRRLCLSERPDVFTRLQDTSAVCHPTQGGGGCDWEGNMDGRLGETENVVKTAGVATDGDASHLVDTSASWPVEFYRHRLVVLRPGAGEERRRVVANDTQLLRVDTPWSSPPQRGDRYEIRGSFDPAWVMRVPRAVHQDTLARFWESARTRCLNGPCAPAPEPLDPFASGNQRGWEKWISRSGLEALANPESVPALYGYGYDGGSIVDFEDRGHAWSDPYFRASSVVMNLRDPAYRAWRIRYLAYKMAEYGLERGEPACVVVAYKPGYHAYYDQTVHGPPSERCGAPGTNNWFGPVHMCSDGVSFGGPMHPTQYGPGEFEAGISAYFRELLQALAAMGRGNTRIITGEAPQFRGEDWTTLADDVRKDPRMLEQQGGWIHPPLSELATQEDPGAGEGGGTGTDGGAGPGAGAGPTEGGGTPSAAPASSSVSESRPTPTSEPSARRGEMTSGSGGGGGTIEPPDAE